MKFHLLITISRFICKEINIICEGESNSSKTSILVAWCHSILKVVFIHFFSPFLGYLTHLNQQHNWTKLEKSVSLSHPCFYFKRFWWFSWECHLWSYVCEHMFNHMSVILVLSSYHLFQILSAHWSVYPCLQNCMLFWNLQMLQSPSYLILASYFYHHGIVRNWVFWVESIILFIFWVDNNIYNIIFWVESII